MTDQGNHDPLHAAIEQLAALNAVVRFEDNGVLRLAAVDPSDADERVVVRLRPNDGDWQSAVIAGAELLTSDLAAVVARQSLRLLR